MIMKAKLYVSYLENGMKLYIVELHLLQSVYGGQVNKKIILFLFLFAIFIPILFIGTMPEDYELYYGFTRFAMELNELDLETAKLLPKTDTRFRPDQRYIFT